MPGTAPAPATPAFRSPADAEAFSAAYDTLLARWPVPFEAVDAPTAYGTARVLVCGPQDAPPLVLLPGGGATSAVWYANVGALARVHRVHAVDLVGDVGRSVHRGRPLRGAADLAAWLGEVLDRLGLDRTHLCGHSYGAWTALQYALHAPARVDRLVLLDPTQCFTGMRARYLLRALPLLRPTAVRVRSFHTWETGGLPLDPDWLELTARGAAGVRRRSVVVMRRPPAGRLRTLTAPTLVLAAGRSRAQDPGRLVESARRLLPHARTAVLAGTSHHTLPMRPADELDRRILEFLALP
ncbi:alpha/beta fold hydrolase [Streptacidiphilus sp. ASG 303]|uniref:alpha/beta fold hydrolase n=1 Tax=Streptacidiphilus sp. ASG 303 TaxID=2896847 RepID=UPI001E494455|nr:alpha/beta hydrolase [Streptacidiphilus sp. ASG 303]MCD0480921.1 alpha/beta fold hydrolase [Streptacidiphilus sp. ASG 303]